MLDSNFASDQAKIAYVAGLPNGRALILDAVEEEARISIRQLEDRFGVAEMLAPSQDRTFMASLLYYLGVLTLGEEETDLGKLTLRVPNLVVRKLYVERLRDLCCPIAASTTRFSWRLRRSINMGTCSLYATSLSNASFRCWTIGTIAGPTR